MEAKGNPKYVVKMRKDSISLLKRITISGIFCLALTACASRKDILYLQNLQINRPELFQVKEPRIQNGDILAITVNSLNPELAAPFNLPLVSYASKLTGQVSQTLQLQGYLVENDGCISYPLMGKIPVAGLTKQQVITLLTEKIKEGDYIKDPTVTVAFLNFRVSVLGEVNRPGTFPVDNDRMTILQALSLAGDLTIYGRRDNIVVLREADGKREALPIDLRTDSCLTSPAYFLQQNDIVIISPNKTRVQMSAINQNSNTGAWISVVSSATSVAALLITIMKASK